MSYTSIRPVRSGEFLISDSGTQSTKTIARSLDISVKTVESHRAQVTEKLSIHDIAGLVRFAIRTGIVKVE